MYIWLTAENISILLLKSSQYQVIYQAPDSIVVAPHYLVIVEVIEREGLILALGITLLGFLTE